MVTQSVLFFLASFVVAGGPASNPLPHDNRSYIDPEGVVLRWSAPQDGDAASYRVFFGTDAKAVGDRQSVRAYRGSILGAADCAHPVGNLDYRTEYCWRIDTVFADGTIAAGQVWKFTTEYVDIPGVVIDYSPDPQSVYIGSPSIARLEDGTYIASHDFFGPKTTHNQTPVFESKDGGRSWRHMSTIDGQFWSNLFVHAGVLYIMGPDAQHGRCIIRRSTDGGATWTTPTGSANGLLFADTMYHTAPMPMLIHNGRIWRTMEDARDPGGWGLHFRAFVMSAPLDADLLNAANWTATNRLSHDEKAWLGAGWLEGNAVVDPQGNVVNILRVAGAVEKAAIVRVGTDGKTATFDRENDFIDFYGGAAKFTIRYDTAGGRYWSLVNRQRDPTAMRNRLVLVSSQDLRHWRVEATILEHPDSANHAWQYIDWLFEGDDIIFVARTAYDTGLGGGAHNYHDANFMTFHRIDDFRRRP